MAQNFAIDGAGINTEQQTSSTGLLRSALNLWKKTSAMVGEYIATVLPRQITGNMITENNAAVIPPFPTYNLSITELQIDLTEREQHVLKKRFKKYVQEQFGLELTDKGQEVLVSKLRAHARRIADFEYQSEHPSDELIEKARRDAKNQLNAQLQSQVPPALSSEQIHEALQKIVVKNECDEYLRNRLTASFPELNPRRSKQGEVILESLVSYINIEVVPFLPQARRKMARWIAQEYAAAEVDKAMDEAMVDNLRAAARTFQESSPAQSLSMLYAQNSHVDPGKGIQTMLDAGTSAGANTSNQMAQAGLALTNKRGGSFRG